MKRGSDKQGDIGKSSSTRKKVKAEKEIKYVPMSKMMKRGSDKQGDIGKSSSTRKKVKAEKEIKYVPMSKIIMDLDEKLESKGPIGGSLSTRAKKKGALNERVKGSRSSGIKHLKVDEPLHELKVIEPGWRKVEVAVSFVEGEPAGAVFILRESGSEGHCLMYEYFPLEGKSELFVEASALYESMTKINSPGFEYKSDGVAFLFESAELLKCLTNPNFPMDNFVKPVIENCKDLLQKKHGEFRFKWSPGLELHEAKIKARDGRASQERFRWELCEGSRET